MHGRAPSPRARSGRALAAAGLAALALSGCDAAEPRSAIDREAYVEIYVEILKAAEEAPDSAAATDSVSAVLKRRGVAPEDLAEFARRHADDPGYLAAVWGEIENRLRERPPPPDTEDERGEPPD